MQPKIASSVIETVQLGPGVEVRISMNVIPEDADPHSESSLSAHLYFFNGSEWRTQHSFGVSLRRGSDVDPEAERERARVELGKWIEEQREKLHNAAAAAIGLTGWGSPDGALYHALDSRRRTACGLDAKNFGIQARSVNGVQACQTCHAAWLKQEGLKPVDA